MNNETVHKVGVSLKQKLFDEFKTRVKETFFADDPLQNFKDQSVSRKLVLGAQALFHVLEWGRDYNLTKLKGDIISGLTIASLCIPQVNVRSWKAHGNTLYQDVSQLSSCISHCKPTPKSRVKL